MLNHSYIFHFNNDISQVEIPLQLNNPFGSFIPEIAKIATAEFQNFIEIESKKWEYDFETEKGKMFGVLVIQNQNNSYCYLASVSGKLPNDIFCKRLIPSVFDESKYDNFLTKGMTELTEIGKKIRNFTTPTDTKELIKERSRKSHELQQKLFSYYQFLNLKGEEKNVLEIFENYNYSKPPAAAGECAAPKLLQYALQNNLKPIALAEFWWGNQRGSNKKHKIFYPACKDRCEPILGFILDKSKSII